MKKYSFGFMAVVLAVMLSAFNTAPQPANTFQQRWFVFTGSPGDENIPEMYEPVSSPLCTSTTAAYRCEILIQAQTADPDLPDLSQTPSEVRKKANP